MQERACVDCVFSACLAACCTPCISLCISALHRPASGPVRVVNSSSLHIFGIFGCISYAFLLPLPPYLCLHFLLFYCASRHRPLGTEALHISLSLASLDYAWLLVSCPFLVCFVNPTVKRVSSLHCDCENCETRSERQWA